MIPGQKTDAFALAFMDVTPRWAACSVSRTWSRSDDGPRVSGILPVQQPRG